MSEKEIQLETKKRLSYPLYRFVRFFVWLFYPKIKLHGLENIPEGPCIIVGNHAKTNGPIAAEIHFPGNRYIWTAGQMMNLKEVQPYVFTDFWGEKPKSIRWLYKILSYIVVPLCLLIFRNAHCIAVYHDHRMLSTFRDTMKALQGGAKIIIFPEHYKAHNNIVCDFQEGFADIARMYYHKEKKELQFIPMYTCPRLKSVYFGKPVKFDSSARITDERTRIANAMMDSITEMARDLPEHTVVPYPNIPKREYPKNTETDKAFDDSGVLTLTENTKALQSHDRSNHIRPE